MVLGLGKSSSVLVPMIALRPFVARLMGVPETVIAGPPGMSVCPSMMYWDKLFAVKISESNVIGGGVMLGPRLRVLLPITTCVALGARLSRVPETVIAGPPGMRVWLSMMYSELLSAV